MQHIRDLLVPFAIIVCFVTLIGAVLYYNVVENKNMSDTIKFAVEKGVDPMAIRCSYPSTNDNVCVAYAASGKKAESAPFLPPSSR